MVAVLSAQLATAHRRLMFKAPFTPSVSTRPIKLMLKIRSIHTYRVDALGVNEALMRTCVIVVLAYFRFIFFSYSGSPFAIFSSAATCQYY